MQSSVRLMVFAVFAICTCFLGSPAGYAQSCVDPSQWCDPWWDGSKTVNNPDCVYYPGTSFLLSTTSSGNPSEGYRANPTGKPCGVTKGVFPAPCGVITGTNTCAETTGGGGGCDPATDYDCCDPFTDPSCGSGGGGGIGPCDGALANDCGDSANPGVGATLRKAALSSPLPRSVSTLLEELAGANAIYLKARVTITNPASGMKQAGSYEYWERDGHYRLRLGPGLRYPAEEIVFDGKFLQTRSNETMVGISRGDKRFTPFPDGPLTLALAPLRVADPAECPACQLRLADLERAMQWRREASEELMSAERVLGAGPFDAGAQRTGESDAAGRLIRLVWPADKASGQHLEITLSDYQPIGGSSSSFPMKLTERLAPNNTSVEYTVEKIDLSPRFQDDVFDIYSTAPNLAFLVVDKTGTVHRRVLRHVPSSEPSSCTKAPAGGKRPSGS